MKKNKILSPIAINLLLDELYEQYGLVLKVKPKIKSHVQKYRTIPFRVDTLNNKSANSRGCFSFLVIPQQKN
ncbi:hypothetical protein LMB21_03870, partial [Limosilactobacillus reuteri]|nr:hypothetical protein [Limosilactobacillus reuteri]